MRIQLREKAALVEGRGSLPSIPAGISESRTECRTRINVGTLEEAGRLLSVRGYFPKSKLATSGISYFEQWAFCLHWSVRGPDHSLVAGEDVVAEPQTPDERSHLFVLFYHLHTGTDLAQKVCSGL